LAPKIARLLLFLSYWVYRAAAADVVVGVVVVVDQLLDDAAGRAQRALRRFETATVLT